MKLASGRIEGFLKAPDPAARAVLVYGPDNGLVRERVDRLVRTVVPDLKDPFRLAELVSGRLKDDPARLADEAQAIALTGGRRAVIVRDAGDTVTSVLSSFLAEPKGDALVVLEAGELGPRSSLRQLCESAGNAAAIPCYADDSGNLAAVIVEELKDHGLKADAETMAYLVDNLGGDRRLTRNELAKLALYVGSSGTVRLEDALACIGDTALISMDDMALAIGDGDHAMAQRIFDRLMGEGTQPVSILRMIARHFQRLHLAAGMISRGSSVDQAMAGLKPPVMFKAAPRFRQQLNRWSSDRIGRALEILIEAETQCKTTGMPASEITSRALMQVTRAGEQPKRRA